MKRCSSKYRSLSWWYHSTPQITNSGLYFRPLFFIPKYFHFTVIILLLNRVNKNTCVRASLFTVHPGILNTIVVSHLELSSLQIPSKALDRLQRCMSRASCQGSHPHHALAAHHPHPHPSLLAPAQVEYLVWMPLCLIYIFFKFIFRFVPVRPLTLTLRLWPPQMGACSSLPTEVCRPCGTQPLWWLSSLQYLLTLVGAFPPFYFLNKYIYIYKMINVK